MCSKVADIPKKIEFTLIDEQVKTLIQAIKHDKRAQVVHRATAVHLLHQGHKVAEVATMISASPPIIYAWHRRFLAKGVAGLANKTKQVVRRKVTAASIAALEVSVPGVKGFFRTFDDLPRVTATLVQVYDHQNAERAHFKSRFCGHSISRLTGDPSSLCRLSLSR